MIRAAIVIVLIACGYSLSADDSARQPETNPKDIARLLERIKDLEQRVSRLEAAAKQTTPIVPLPQSPQYQAPRVYPPAPYSQTPAPNATPIPPAAPDSNVPKTWQPFYFNGLWYYIIPLDEATTRMERSAISNRTSR